MYISYFYTFYCAWLAGHDQWDTGATDGTRLICHHTIRTWRYIEGFIYLFFKTYSTNGISFYRTRALFSERGLLTPLSPPAVEIWAVLFRMICTCSNLNPLQAFSQAFPRLTHLASNTQVQTVAAQHNTTNTKKRMAKKEQKNVQTLTRPWQTLLLSWLCCSPNSRT